MLGLIDFTHSEPLYAAYPRKENVVRDTPKNLLKRLLGGEIDCGMISLFEYFDHRDALEILESATIHSLRGTMSTLLVSRGRSIGKHMEISVTEHTRTTAAYLELILQKSGIEYDLKWSQEREAEKLLDEADYALVIGDEALKVYSTRLKILWDIGYQFSRLFSMSPVFSVTVARKNSSCTEEISDLDLAISHHGEYVEKSVDETSAKLGVERNIIRQYYNTIRYDFTPGVRKTLEFLQKAAIQARSSQMH